MTPSIILIGPPGSGKSSVGNALAKSMHVDFADTDSLIEKDLGKSVSQIFVDDGEPFFRTNEERICCAAIETLSGVLSLGGGSVISQAVRDALKKSGAAIVFLDVSLAVAAPRVGFNRDRPLLLNNPRQQWQTLMEARRPIYESVATIHIEVADDSITDIVKEILSKVVNV